jgi:hypothetical protein
MASMRNVAGYAAEAVANIVLPYLVYIETVNRMGQVHALLAASLPPIVWSGIEFARKRRVDAVSMLVLTGIVLSLLAFLGGGSVRFLQLREKLVTGVIGLIFLGSAAIGRPLIYQLARERMLQKSQREAEEFEKLREHQRFRRSMTVMTLVWGFGLVAEAAVACVLVFSISVQRFLVVGPVVGYGTMACLALWNVWYVKRLKRRGEAARAAQRV